MLKRMIKNKDGTAGKGTGRPESRQRGTGPNAVNRKIQSLILTAALAFTTLFSTGTAVLAADGESADETAQSIVTVKTFSSGEDVVTLDSEVISYTSSSKVTLQAANEEQNGIYFLSGASLGFYSLDDGSYATVYTFDDCVSAYVQGDLLYVLGEETTGTYSNGSYTYTYEVYCYVYDLDAQALSETITFTNLPEEDTVDSVTAIGADESGRIYVASKGEYESEDIYQVWLYGSDGTLYSTAAMDTRVYRFDGFDADSGHFFMESYYNWVYWGYDHPGRAVTMGTVSNNKVSFTETGTSVLISGLLTYNLSCIEYICQSSYYLHQKGADVIGGKYLVTASTTYGRLMVLDPDSLDQVLYLSRSAIEEEQDDDYYDLNSIGVRAVYNESDDSVIVYENEKTLNEYDTDSGEVIGSYETAHYVFNLLTMGDDVVVIEKEDDQFYLEVLNWTSPTNFTISGSSTMKVGQTQQLTVSSDSSYMSSYSWTSSNSKVVSVTEDGVASAWKSGTATIKYTSPNGNYSASFKITVSGSTVSTPSSVSKTLSGTVTNNISDNNYTTYGSIVNSYLTQNDDGTYTRVEDTGSGILVETYSSSWSRTSKKTLSEELSYFGGFYAGEDYNYLVFGAANSSESDSKEVVRVVKYSKSWSRISACKITGANTYEAFEAGSLRMTELDGLLYIYTCHTMYEEDDGLHHQANMTFVVDESSMEVTDSYYDVLNISQAGYVSHSFNQFIQTDGEYIFRVDHGDAYPRAVSITKCKVGDSITSVSYTEALEIQGSTGANSTGVSVGGFELSDENCLIAGNSVDQSSSSSYSASGQRNIFLTVTDKSGLDTEIIWITDYSKSDGVTPRTPQLVKLSDDRFLLMWEEYYSTTGETGTRMVTVNGEGTITSSITCSSVRLSDCQPIANSSGRVVWYVTDGSSATLYTINPYDLPNDLSVSTLTGKKTQKITVKKSSLKKTIKYKKLKKKKQTFKIKASAKGNAKITYKKVKGNKKIKVSKKGKVTVKKGLSKGTYKVKVKIKAAATKTYKKKTVTKTITIKVK